MVEEDLENRAIERLSDSGSCVRNDNGVILGSSRDASNGIFRKIPRKARFLEI